jgi:hypothetical protein
MVLNVLTTKNGFTEIDTRTYVGPNDTIDVHTYRVDLDRLAIPADEIFVAPDALDRLIERMSATPDAARAAAGALADRIVAPTDGSETALLNRLNALAGR